MRPDIVVFDRMDSVIARATAAACIEADLRPMEATEDVGFAQLLREHGAQVCAVVLDAPASSEGGFDPRNPSDTDVDRICTALAEEVSGFLNACREATQAFMPRKRGAVWALCVDDVASDLALGLTAPAASQARIGAIKSLAKEYGRMGLTYHALVCQPSRESADVAQWRTVRGALKVYALRYSAPLAQDYGRFLVAALAGGGAINGSVVTMGVGAMEMGA